MAELMTSERFHPRPAGRGTRLPRESWNLSACCFRFLPHLRGGGPGTLLEGESSTFYHEPDGWRKKKDALEQLVPHQRRYTTTGTDQGRKDERQEGCVGSR